MSAPFHCALMKPAASVMKEKIDKINFLKPKVDIVSNVTSNVESDPEKIKKLLIEQIFHTVRWRESIENISNKGIKNYIELGPGKVLIGMVKRTIKDANCFSINSIADIKNFTDEFKNKKVLITGSTGGIGHSLVEKFYSLETEIIATGTKEDKLEKLKKI